MNQIPPEEVKIAPWDAWWNKAMTARQKQSQRTFGWGVSENMYDFSNHAENLRRKWQDLQKYSLTVPLIRP